MHININTSAVVAFTNKLEKMHKAALPVAVRETLSRTALNVKQQTMPASAEKSFVNRRNKNFFKANSRVEFAKGYNISTMRAIVGFTPHTAQYNSEAVQELQQQEYGGTIDDRDYIPLNGARSGGNKTPVRPQNRLKQIKSETGGLGNIVDATKGSRRQFVKKAMGVGSWANSASTVNNWTASKRSVQGGYIIGGFHGKKILYRVSGIERIGRNTKIKTTPLYSYKKGRSVGIDEDTHFMRTASLRSASNMHKIFIQEAEKQFARIKK